jgi:uncharacterized protein
MVTAEAIRFRNNLGRDLAGRIYSTGRAADTGVIFSHGLFSTKDGYKITRLADGIASSGHTLMTFDFSFAGESGGNIADLSILQEVEDLASAVRWFKGRGIRKIHLMGSSMGAAVTILYASRLEPGIESLILIAAPVDLGSLLVDGAGITDVGSLPVDGTTLLEGIPVKNSLFREIDRIDMPGALRKIAAPVLVIHGGLDRVVDPRNAGLIEKYLSAPLKKIIVPDGDHNLTRDGDITILGDVILSWLRGAS